MRIDSNKILQFNRFYLEKDLYYLLYYIIMVPNSILYSDLETYIIGSIGKDYPIWIWSNDEENINLLVNDLNEILDLCENEITCSRKLYNKLKVIYNISNYMDIGFYTCDKGIKPEDKGIVLKATYDDVSELLEYFKKDSLEVDNLSLNDNEVLNEINYFINRNEIYLLKNNNKIVSICCYTKLDDMAKITRVYTPLKYRNNGYCKWLIYNVTKMLLKEKYRVLLYTDYNYLPSNSAYKRIGYKKKSILARFNINK